MKFTAFLELSTTWKVLEIFAQYKVLKLDDKLKVSAKLDSQLHEIVSLVSESLKEMNRNPKLNYNQ